MIHPFCGLDMLTEVASVYCGNWLKKKGRGGSSLYSMYIIPGRKELFMYLWSGLKVLKSDKVQGDASFPQGNLGAPGLTTYVCYKL